VNISAGASGGGQGGPAPVEKLPLYPQSGERIVTVDAVTSFRHMYVEQFAGHCHIVAIAADIQETTQDGTVCLQLSRLLAVATYT